MIVSGILSGCAKTPSDNQGEQGNSEQKIEQSTDEESKDKEENKSKDNDSGDKGEEELQLGEGINGDLPDIEYTYEAIVNAPGGVILSRDKVQKILMLGKNLLMQN